MRLRPALAAPDLLRQKSPTGLNPAKGSCDDEHSLGPAGRNLLSVEGPKTIIAINKDEDAPIFHVADIGFVRNLFSAVPGLAGKL